MVALLAAAQIKEFNAWYLKYGETTLDESDPAGVSDRMTNTLEFYGTGTAKPGRADQQALFDWAKTLFQKLNS
jgi:heptaprenylglyceryl phosphate synthase